uniref:G-protein coupled receptors family 1 profile domain-containing protein n=1 Tax=Acrobeloides nanus TaxID=290746 RepID=A0A914BZX8_9BILA
MATTSLALPSTSGLSSTYHAEIITSTELFSNTSNKSEGQCTDIKNYLWANHGDLTSLPYTMSLFGIVYTLIITLGVVGNTLVVISILKHKSLQSVRNMFIMSLSCSDIVVSIVSGSITPITAFTKIWLFGYSLCKLVPLIQGASLCFSTLTLTAISIDRFILIIFPTGRPIQKRQAFYIIGVNIGIALGISLPMFFKQVLVEYENFCGLFCTEDWGETQSDRSTYGTIVFMIQFVIPFILITFCYLMISLRLGKGMLLKKNSVMNNFSTEQRRQALKRRLRTNRMLIAMVAVFTLCWTPAVAFNFLRDFAALPTFVVQQEYLVGILTHCISMSSTVWNPCLYALLNEQFRFAFVDLLQWIRRGDNPLKGRKLPPSPTTARLVGLATRLGSDSLVLKDGQPQSNMTSSYDEKNDSIKNGYGGATTTTNVTLTDTLSFKNEMFDMALPTDSFL